MYGLLNFTLLSFNENNQNVSKNFVTTLHQPVNVESTPWRVESGFDLDNGQTRDQEKAASGEENTLHSLMARSETHKNMFLVH